MSDSRTKSTTPRSGWWALLPMLVSLATFAPSACTVSQEGLATAPDANDAAGGAGNEPGAGGEGAAGGSGGTGGQTQQGGESGTGGVPSSGGSGAGSGGRGGTGAVPATGGVTGSGGTASGGAGQGGKGPLAANGQGCDGNGACASGHCVDRVCCDAACDGGCSSCSLPGTTGQCRPIPAGQPPRSMNACPVEDASTCGRTGACNGAGACAAYAEGTTCQANACMNDGLASNYRCQQGRCVAGAVAACAADLRCRGMACPARCDNAGDCLGGLSCLAGACLPNGAATIPFAATAPQIDGIGDDLWGGVMGGNAIAKVTSGMVSGGDADLSGGWKMLWDNQALYVIVAVRDASLRADSALPWQDDAVEVFIDADYSRGAAYDGRNDHQYVFGWKAGGVPALAEVALSRTQNVVVAQQNFVGGYVMEARIPWATLGIAPAAGQRLGIDVQIDDDDDGGARDGQKAWNATTDIAWQRPDAFGSAVLLAP